MLKQSIYRLGRRFTDSARSRLNYITYLSSLKRKRDDGPIVVPYADAAAVIAALGTDLIEFWDADYTAGITLVNTNKVSSWVGRKASGVVPVQGTDANRPIYDTTSWGRGRASLQFGATTKRLSAPAIVALPDGSTPFELWMLTDQKSGAGTQRVINWPNATNNTNVAILHFQSAPAGKPVEERYIVLGGTGAAQNQIIAGKNFINQRVTRARFEAGQIMGGVNEKFVYGLMPRVANALGGVPATGNLSIGSGATGGSIWTGLIRKILITNLLTDDQAAKLAGYLENEI